MLTLARFKSLLMGSASKQYTALTDLCKNTPVKRVRAIPGPDFVCSDGTLFDYKTVKKERTVSDDLVTTAVTKALENAPFNDDAVSVEAFIYDHKQPAFARATVLLMRLNATSTILLKQADMLPALYAKHDGKPCRVTLVSALGDVGINHNHVDMGYYQRGLSLYDLTDFSQTPWEE